MHGQSEQLRLKSAVAQREALDRYAGDTFAEAFEHYQTAYRRWQANRDELGRLVADRDLRAAEASELRASLAEIEVVAPQPGEDVELQQRVLRMANAEELRLAATQAHELLSSENDAIDVLGLIGEARRTLERAAELDPELAALAEQVDRDRLPRGGCRHGHRGLRQRLRRRLRARARGGAAADVRAGRADPKVRTDARRGAPISRRGQRAAARARHRRRPHRGARRRDGGRAASWSSSPIS